MESTYNDISIFRCGFFQLSAEEVTIQLALDDFAIFYEIETVEFVEKMFGLGDDSDCGDATATTANKINNKDSSRGEKSNAEKAKTLKDFTSGYVKWTPL